MKTISVPVKLRNVEMKEPRKTTTRNGAMTMKRINVPVKLRSIEITDPLFGGYVDLVEKKIIPYQWAALNDQIEDAEKSHCIDNFRIAAGEMSGHHRGAVFQDTDLYKWLEALAYCIENGRCKNYIEAADEMIDLIRRAQEPDGYLNTYITIEHPELRWKNLVEGHELYGAGHLIEAAVAYYNATGKDVLLQVAQRLADLIDKVFGPEEGQCKGVPGHQEIELALVKLYRTTGEKRYLRLAKFFLSERGKRPNYLTEEIKRNNGPLIFPEFSEYDEEYAQTHETIFHQKTAEGHAVRAMYMYSAMADLAAELEDEELAKACETLYKNVTTRRMYITGGIGSSGKLERFTVDYDLPNETMYCESCASIGLMMFAQRMAALTGEARYYDVVERALCNTVLAGIQKTGDRYFYVNPLAVWPDNCKASTSMSHVKPVRQKWFSTACCPPNIARTLASLGQYIYAQNNNTLYINQFISSKAAMVLQDGEVSVKMESTYMQNGCVKITLRSSASKPVECRVRMPKYMHNAVVTCNGAACESKMQAGYAVFTLAQPGELVLQITAEVRPMFVAANRNVRADAGRLAMMKGPFVYCLEQEDNGENLSCVYVNSKDCIRQQAPCEALPGDLPTLVCDGERLTQTINEADALYGTPEFRKEQVSLKAVPYALWCNRTPGEMQVWIKAKL